MGIKMPRGSRQPIYELNGRRRTVLFQDDNTETRFSELYPYMLMEDVRLRVMPLGARFTEREISVDLEPASGSFENILSQAFHPDGPGSLTYSTCHFLSECSQIVMAFGRAVYEIVYLRDSTGTVARIEFEFVPPTSIEIGDDWAVQHIPAEIAAHREISAEIRIPRADVILFEPPFPTKKLKRMVDALAQVSRLDLPEFVGQELRGETKVGWSASEDVHFKTLAVAEVCREIGWDARGMFREEFLEYYEIIRRLRFETFLALLRRSLLGSLNSALVSIGTVLGETGKLVVTGLPTEDDVLSARRRLERGQSDLKAVIEPFSLF